MINFGTFLQISGALTSAEEGGLPGSAALEHAGGDFTTPGTDPSHECSSLGHVQSPNLPCGATRQAGTVNPRRSAAFAEVRRCRQGNKPFCLGRVVMKIISAGLGCEPLQ